MYSVRLVLGWLVCNFHLINFLRIRWIVLKYGKNVRKQWKIKNLSMFLSDCWEKPILERYITSVLTKSRCLPQQLCNSQYYTRAYLFIMNIVIYTLVVIEVYVRHHKLRLSKVAGYKSFICRQSNSSDVCGRSHMQIPGTAQFMVNIILI